MDIDMPIPGMSAQQTGVKNFAKRCGDKDGDYVLVPLLQNRQHVAFQRLLLCLLLKSPADCASGIRSPD
jgi:hypothetical protein